MNIDFDKPFGIDFSLVTGLSEKYPSSKRYLSNMTGMYADEAARAAMEAEEDRLVYEFYELGMPEIAGDISFGTSIVYPGTVGGEYFMTNGHFHTILETGEVYLCLRGEGFMLQENPEGEWDAVPLKPGAAVYCPKRFAHRSVNTGTDRLVTFFAYRADSGHNYGIIKERGYKKLIVERDGKPTVIDNPRRQ